MLISPSSSSFSGTHLSQLVFFTDSEGYLNSAELLGTSPFPPLFLSAYRLTNPRFPPAKTEPVVRRHCVSQKQATRLSASLDGQFLFAGDEQNMIKVFRRRGLDLEQVGAFPLHGACSSLTVAENFLLVGDDHGDLYLLKWNP